jgi:putative ABC transport system permease protein
MIRVALAGLLGRKLRTALTAFAVVLGVGMVSGTLVLTDSIDKAFNFIFTDVRKGSDVVVSGKSPFHITEGRGTFAPTIPQSLVTKVRALPDVALADGGVKSEATQLQPGLQHRERRLALQPAQARLRRLAARQ